jgi:hypothetical protein
MSRNFLAHILWAKIWQYQTLHLFSWLYEMIHLLFGQKQVMCETITEHVSNQS